MRWSAEQLADFESRRNEAQVRRAIAEQTGAIVIDLPLPISVNRIWRANKAGKKRVSISPEYESWRRRADMLVIAMGALRGMKCISGKFEVEIVVKRTAGDLDNRIKGCLDYLQRCGAISDDKNTEKITVSWGDAPHGCRVTIKPVGAQ